MITLYTKKSGNLVGVGYYMPSQRDEWVLVKDDEGVLVLMQLKCGTM